MKHISGASQMNDYFDTCISHVVMNEARKRKLISDPIKKYEYDWFTRATPNMLEHRFPDIYKEIIHGKKVFDFSELRVAFIAGYKVCEHMCKTNQKKQYVFMDEEDYKGSKYEHEYEHRNENCVDPNTVGRYWVIE